MLNIFNKPCVMWNLFKKQWLPDYVREYIKKQFPVKWFRVAFIIGGKPIPIDRVVGNERNIKSGEITYTDVKGDTVTKLLVLGPDGEFSCDAVDRTLVDFGMAGIEIGVRNPPTVGKPKLVAQLRKEVSEKLSKLIDYCPGSLLDKTHSYPISDMPRWRRKKILHLLADLSEESIPVFVDFDIQNVAESQLQMFNAELDLAMLVENTYEPEQEADNGST